MPRVSPRSPKGSARTHAPLATPPEFSLGPPIRATARAVEELAARVARDPNVDAEVLHRFHQQLRKLRIDVRAVRELLPERHRPLAFEAVRKIGRLSRLVGDVRDLDVTHTLVMAPSARTLSGSREGLSEVRHRLVEEARTGRSLLGAFVRADIDQGLFREPDRLLDVAGRRLDGPAARFALQRIQAREVRRTERARRRAVRRPDPERSHDFRIGLRRVRLVAELRVAAAGRRSARFPELLRGVQADLGALHDLHRLAELLEELGGVEGPFARAAEERGRQLEQETRERYRKRSFRAVLEAMAR